MSRSPLQRCRALFSALLLALLFALSGLSSAELAAQAEEPPAPDRDVALMIPIQRQIDFRTVALLKRGLDEARSIGASRVILAIDTPGGTVIDTREIVSMLSLLRQRDVDTVAWVQNKGLSAGALIALSCRRVFVASGSTTGAATPIRLQSLPTGLEEEARYSKLLSAFRAEARAMAEHRGETVQLLAEAMVDPRLELRELRYRGESGLIATKVLPSEEAAAFRQKDGVEVLESRKVGGGGEPPLTLGADEALRLGLAEGIVESTEGLARQLGLRESDIEIMEPNWSEELAAFLQDVSLFLLIGGIIALLLAVQIPGTGVPEVMAFLCFALFFAGNYLVGLAEWTEILLFALGVGLVLVEVFVIPGTIISGLAGLIAIVAALFLSLQPFLSPEGMREEELLTDNLWNLIFVFVGSVVFGLIGSRLLPKLPFFRRVILTHDDEGQSYEHSGTSEDMLSPLVGRVGVVTSDLRPSGKIEVDGEPVDVVSDAGFLPKGSRVRVSLVEGNRVVVVSDSGGDESGAIAISLLLLLALIGFVLMAAEVFIPSFGILSILSALALVFSVFLGFQHGPEVGISFLVGVGTLTPIVLWFAFKALPNTPIGRMLILRGPSFEPRESLVRDAGIEAMVGKRGRAATDLRPAGSVEIEGRRWDAMTRGEMIDLGCEVEVLRVEMSQLVVRSAAAIPAANAAPEIPTEN